MIIMRLLVSQEIVCLEELYGKFDGSFLLVEFASGVPLSRLGFGIDLVLRGSFVFATYFLL